MSVEPTERIVGLAQQAALQALVSCLVRNNAAPADEFIELLGASEQSLSRHLTEPERKQAGQIFATIRQAAVDGHGARSRR